MSLRNEKGPYGEHERQTEREVGFLDLLLFVSSYARLLVIGPIIAAAVAYGGSFLWPATYTATARLLPPQHQTLGTSLTAQLGPLANIAGIGGIGIRNPADLYVSIIRSRTVADRVVARLDLPRVYDEHQMHRVRRLLNESTKVTAGKDGIITIDVDAGSPDIAADITNAYVHELIRLTGELAVTEAQQRRVFFEKHMREAHDNLKLAEAALAESGVSESVANTAPQAVLERVGRLHAQQTSQEIRLSTMRSYLTEDSAEYKLAQRELDSIKQQLGKAEQEAPARRGKSSNYLGRYRDFKYHEALFELLTKQFELAKLDEAREGPVIQVIDRAIPPDVRSKPVRRIVSLVAFVLASVVLTLLAVAHYVLHDASRDPASNAKLLELRAALRRIFSP